MPRILSATAGWSFVGALFLGFASPSEASITDLYRVQLYNSDDQTFAFITNAEFDMLQVATLGYAPVGPVQDISLLVRPGPNTITFTVDERIGGFWIYGFRVIRNEETIFDIACGVQSIVGCNQIPLTNLPQLAYSTSFQFDVAAPQTPAIPEPATWAMMIAGFGLVGAVARRRIEDGGQKAA